MQLRVSLQYFRKTHRQTNHQVTQRFMICSGKHFHPKLSSELSWSSAPRQILDILIGSRFFADENKKLLVRSECIRQMRQRKFEGVERWFKE